MPPTPLDGVQEKQMNASQSFPPALIIAMLAIGCGSPPAATPVASAPTTSPTTNQASGEFGVAECDQYMKKYMACIDGHVPEAARAMVRQSLDQSREQWRRAAATPEGKQGLAAACQQAEATSRTAMQAYGCQW
jgi:hypothetical protein